MRSKSIDSGLAIARELATITCVWQIHKVKERRGKALQWKKGKLQVCPDWRLLA